MSDPKPITAWAVVGCMPKGRRWIVPGSIARTRFVAIRAFSGGLAWKYWRAKGYTCERVVVSLAPKRKAR